MAVHFARLRGFLIAIKGSIAGLAALFALDGGLLGSFLLSFLICPIWFLVSLLHNAFTRPGWGVALARVAMPALAFYLIKANSDYQNAVAEVNARRVIAACEAYNATHGQYPKKLNELVPQYLDAIPPAKHCLGPSSVFSYYNLGAPSLYWHIAGFYRKIYNFETRSWRYLD